MEKGIKTFGVDSPTPDNPISKTYPCHMMCRANRITHYENLGLSQVLNRRFTFIGLPLKTVGAHGGPTRAAALIESERRWNTCARPPPRPRQTTRPSSPRSGGYSATSVATARSPCASTPVRSTAGPPTPSVSPTGWSRPRTSTSHRTCARPSTSRRSRSAGSRSCSGTRCSTSRSRRGRASSWATGTSRSTPSARTSRAAATASSRPAT